MTSTTSRTVAVRAPGVVLFLAFIDIFALLPTVAPHVAELGAGPIGVGLAVGAYSATNLPANVLGGILVDRWGRRRVTLLGLLGAAAAVLGYLFAGSVATFLLARGVHGVAGGILIPAIFAAAGDRTQRGTTGRTFGRLGAVIGAAAVVAPAGAGVLRQAAGTPAVFLAIAAALVLGAIIAYLGVHDAPHHLGGGSPSTTPDVEVVVVDPTERAPAMAVPTGSPPASSQVLLGLLRVGMVRRALLATAVLTAAVGVLAGFLPAAATALGATPSTIGSLFTVYAIFAAGVMLSPLAGHVDTGRADTTITIGLVTLSGALLTFAVAPNLAVALVGAAVFGVGYGLIFPAVAAATSSSASAASRGRAFGLFNVAFSLGLAAGPPLTGGLVDRVPAIDPFVPVAGLALIAAAAVAGSAWFRRRTAGG